MVFRDAGVQDVHARVFVPVPTASFSFPKNVIVENEAVLPEE